MAKTTNQREKFNGGKNIHKKNKQTIAIKKKNKVCIETMRQSDYPPLNTHVHIVIMVEEGSIFVTKVINILHSNFC